MKRLFVIDALAMAFRTFYGLGQAGLSRADGFPVSALYGSSLFLNKLIREEKPDYLLAARDLGGPTFRHEKYKNYKVNRDKAPSDLSLQLPEFWRLLDAFKIPYIGQPGYEADDVIASVASQFSGEHLHVYIVSGDKDFYQILGPRVTMYAPKKNAPAMLVTPYFVMENFLCAP